ncbi:protease inhibitor I42 family protein [Deinococcus altitudinis]|uniref:protease inhibitor I42 family protein n=1 Tax=Deinococcus altitudinis TaxID=468914 RepID=UPI003891E705
MLKNLFFLSALALFSVSHAQSVTTTRTLNLTAADAGKDLEVRAGDLVRVSFASTPGTGYSWRALEADSTYLTLIDKVTAAPASTGNARIVGGPGPLITYVYYVRTALKQGGATLSLPLIFTQTPPGRVQNAAAQLVQFNLTSK